MTAPLTTLDDKERIAASAFAVPTVKSLLDAINPQLYPQFAKLSTYAASQDLQAMLTGVLIQQAKTLAAIGQVAINAKDVSAILDRLEDIESKLATILSSLPPKPGPAAHFHFSLLEIPMSDFTIGDAQFQDLAVSFFDAANLPTTDANPLTFSTSDADIASADMSPPEVQAVAPANTVAIRVTSSKVKLGTAAIGVSDGTVNGTFNAVVVGGPVVSMGFQPIGSPQDQPA